MARLADTFVLRRASIYTNPTNPADRLPLVYGDLTVGDGGIVPCVCIQEWNFSTRVFLIADHAIDATPPTVFVNGAPASAAFNPADNFEGQGVVATLTFNSMAQQTVAVKCKGLLAGAVTGSYTPIQSATPTGSLLTNLVEIVLDLALNRHRIAGAEWNVSAFAQAFMDATALGYVGGGMILDDGDLATLANQILQPIGGAYVDSRGQLTLYIETVPADPVVEEVFDESEIEMFRAERAIDDVVNAIELQYRFGWAKRFFASQQRHFDAELVQSDGSSQSTFKVRARQLEAPWLRSLTAATNAASKLLSLSRQPRWHFTLGLRGYKALLQQPGDVVAFSHRRLPGGSAPGRPGYRRLMRVKRVGLGLEGEGVELSGVDLESNYAG